MENKIEIWKDVIGYEDVYQVSNFGNIRTLKFNKKRILKKYFNNNGYLSCSLWKNGIIKTRTIHQLVAESFLNHIPCGHKLVINHKNFIRTDNRVENIEIITQRENTNKQHIKSSSQFVGVSWANTFKKWTARININNKQKNLGYFTTEIEAKEFYDNAIEAIKNNVDLKIKRHIFSSEYKGVSWSKSNKKWLSQITIKGKVKNLGYFLDELEASNAYQNELLKIKKN